MKRQKRAVPARKASGNTNNTNDGKRRISPTMGLFPSIKMARMVAYTNTLGKDLLYILDFHPQVIEFKERPFSLEYPHISERRKVTYLPDYVVRTPERTLLVECLASWQLEVGATKDRHAALRLWCATNTYAMAFTYVTERGIRSGCYLANVKLLTHHSRHAVDAPTRASIYNILEDAPLQLTIGQVAMRLNPDFPDDAIPDLLHMAYNGELYVPLHDWVVTGNSPVCLPYQLPDSLVPPPNYSTDIPALSFLNGCDADEKGR